MKEEKKNDLQNFPVLNTNNPFKLYYKFIKKILIQKENRAQFS